VAETVRSALRNTDDPDEFRRYLLELKDIIYETEFEGDLDEKLYENLTEHVEWLREFNDDSISDHHRSSIIDDVHRVERFCQRRGRSNIDAPTDSVEMPAVETEPSDGDVSDADTEETEELSVDEVDTEDAASGLPSDTEETPVAADCTFGLGSNDDATEKGTHVSSQPWVEDEPADLNGIQSDDSLSTSQIGSDRPDWLDSGLTAAVSRWQTVKWPYSQPPKTRSGYYPNATIPDTVTARESFTVTDPEFLSMVLDEETVYVAAGGLYAFDREVGHETWSLPRPKKKRHYGRPLLEEDGDTLWVGAAGRTVEQDVKLRCINTDTGEITEAIDVGPGIESSPIQSDTSLGTGKIIISCNDSTVRAYSTLTHINDWTVRTEESVHHSPAIADGIGVVCDNGGTAIAFNTDDGTVQWERSYGGGLARPTIGTETVFLPIKDKIAALDLNTGRRKYELPKGGHSTPSPAFAHNTLFVPGTLFDPNLHAFDVGDSDSAGDERWRANVIPKADPLVFGETLMVGGHDGVYAINVRDGSQKWHHATDEKCTALAAAPNRGSKDHYILYAGLADGRILKLDSLW
jgi:outer membrane protein assembly factor BamB